MISKTSVHALSAVAVLAELAEGEYMGAAPLARKIGAPENYLGKLLQGLAKGGVVVARKGVGGGFRLARDPRDVSLYDVVERIEHVSRWEGCFLGRDKCSEETHCAVHERWGAVRDAYLHFLRETTVYDLLRAPQRSATSSK